MTLYARAVSVISAAINSSDTLMNKRRHRNCDPVFYDPGWSAAWRISSGNNGDLMLRVGIIRRNRIQGRNARVNSYKTDFSHPSRSSHIRTGFCVRRDPWKVPGLCGSKVSWRLLLWPRLDYWVPVVMFFLKYLKKKSFKTSTLNLLKFLFSVHLKLLQR